MVDDLLENIESDIRLYDRRVMSGDLVVDWLKIHLEKYKLQKARPTLQDEIQSRNAMATYQDGKKNRD